MPLPPSSPLWKILLGGGNFLRIRVVLPLYGKNPPNSIWRAPIISLQKILSPPSIIVILIPIIIIIIIINLPAFTQGKNCRSHRWKMTFIPSLSGLAQPEKRDDIEILQNLDFNFEKWLNSHHLISKKNPNFSITGGDSYLIWAHWSSFWKVVDTFSEARVASPQIRILSDWECKCGKGTWGIWFMSLCQWNPLCPVQTAHFECRLSPTSCWPSR